ncbi:putative Regulatory-associated protein of mTOR [Corchorus olitorius]|uniref:Regulatory-associated protein of mTOR n=1 Tax=Corchorus olitorius TaxID=93759 RepID=A0A1R3HFX4_9ROSI|nr:putative Regulatory-associated protein of mTOR [Corchorus olitorius]
MPSLSFLSVALQTTLDLHEIAFLLLRVKHTTLPQCAEFPADVFTSCLTTPIKSLSGTISSSVYNVEFWAMILCLEVFALLNQRTIGKGTQQKGDAFKILDDIKLVKCLA